MTALKKLREIAEADIRLDTIGTKLAMMAAWSPATCLAVLELLELYMSGVTYPNKRDEILARIEKGLG